MEYSQCLRSVFHETRNAAFEIIVLDNASSDGSIDAIDVEFGERIKLISSEENLGFTAGNNNAIKSAIGNYILLLNPGTIVLDGAIDKLIIFANKNTEAKIWGGKTLFKDRSHNPSSCWSKLTIWSLLMQATGLSSIFKNAIFFNPEGIGGWDRGGDRKVDIVSGCFLLIKKCFWDKLDGFHSDFFMYGEETDLCLRAHSYSASPMVSSSATIIHYGGASEKVRADKLVRLLKAKMLLIEKHFSQNKRKIAYNLLKFWPVSRAWIHFILFKIRLSTSENYQGWKEAANRMDEWEISNN